MEQEGAGSSGRETVPPPPDTASGAGPAHSRSASSSQESTAALRSGDGLAQSGTGEHRRQPSHGSVPGGSAGLAASRPDSASPIPSTSDGGRRSDPSGPTSPASSHARPPSALSSTSSSHHPRGLSSPRSNQPSYTSSSLSSAAAFDYDDLLGPRRAHSSTTGPSLSPPSSNEGDKRPPGGGSRLRGLGFDSSTLHVQPSRSRERERDGRSSSVGGGAADWAAGDMLEDPNLHESEIDETWLHLDAITLDRQPNSPPIASAAAATHSRTTYANPVGDGSSTFTVGSPLSPLVPPFAPSSVSTSSQQSGSARPNPWSSSTSVSSLASLAERTREREASWASSSPGMASTTSSQRAFPHLSSPSSFSPSPAIPCSSQMSSAQAYFSAQTPVQTSSLFSYGSTVQDTPQSAIGTEVYPTRHPSYASTLMPESAASLEAYQGVDRALLSRFGSLQPVPTASGPGSTSGADSVSSGSVDEVTTVFVVGFPDDMTEREFQNMFTFAEGFEAASLKLPVPNDDEQAPRPSQDDVPPFSTLPQYLLHATRDPFALPRESMTVSSNGSASAAATGGGGGTTAPRKQIIGFARFVTRQHALAAADILSGRKVDQEKSMVLKAEMAKKNLHFKKSATPSIVGAPDGTNSTSTPTTATSAALYPATAPLAPQQQQSTLPRMPTTPNLPSSQPTPSTSASSLEAAAASVAAAATTAASAMGGSGPSIPLSALDSATLAKLANVSNLNPAVLAEIARQSALAGPKTPAPSTAVQDPYRTGGGDVPYPKRRESYSTISGFDAGGGDAYAESMAASSSTTSQPQSYSTAAAEGAYGRQPYARAQQYETNPNESARGPPPPPQQTLDQAALVAQAMLRQQQQQQHLQHAARDSSGATRGQSYIPFPTVLGGATTAPQQLPMQSPPLGYAAPRTQNPADMNAPKNTLYVGGLPAVLPSLTGPFSASHLEDSLRNAFSRCPGYKRLQFRSKSNGPIVFVEFVDTAHATRAMQELYGHTLGGLVKGGIRLSYSKNPLGVRSNGIASGNPSPMPLQHAAMEGQQSSPYISSPYANTPGTAAAGQFDPFDPHRRPPDPIYGEATYSSHGGAAAALARSPPTLSPLSQPNVASSYNNFSTAPPGSQASPAQSSASLYGGNFSPFSFDP